MNNDRLNALLVRIAGLVVMLTTVYLYSAPQGKVNGSSALWNKRYNEVAYPATHNGHSHAESSVQNQTLSLKEQLERGIRATKMHVYYHQENNGAYAPFVCHGVSKDLLEGPYLEKIVEKVPRLFRGWAQDVLKQMAPLNELVRDACHVAYGDGKTKGVIPFKHCILDPSRRKLSSMLAEVKQFMAKNPSEVVTLILEDHTNSLDQIAQEFVASGLDAYVHTQDSSKEWPTLGHMVESGKRIVVLVHGDESLAYEKYPWLHNVWQYAWDTEWEFQDAADLKDTQKDVMPKRGLQAFKQRNEGPKNKLFIVHHFVTSMSGGNKVEAKKINKKSFLQTRLERLAKKAGHMPNIIQVDFFEQPGNDIFEVVNAFNEKK